MLGIRENILSPRGRAIRTCSPFLFGVAPPTPDQPKTSCITSWQLEFFVVDGGDEEEAQAESAAAISVAVSDNLEAFEHGDDIFARHALAGDVTVLGLVACG